MYIIRFSPNWLTSSTGFGVEQKTDAVFGEVSQTRRSFWVPHWFIVLLAMVLPAVQLRRILVARLRILENRCSVCGYDWRATPDRCPECGTVPAKK